VGVVEILGAAIWFILPAYVANATPVVFGGGRPIDGGRKFSDGRSVFGPGKTIRGFLVGLIAGSVFGVIQGLATGNCTLGAVGFLLSLGALVGDLFGSFVKRRLNVPRGGAAPVLDQLGFAIFAIILASPLTFPGWAVTATVLIITIPIHLATNLGGYLLKLKDRPY